jgi:hypothetical protein
MKQTVPENADAFVNAASVRYPGTPLIMSDDIKLIIFDEAGRRA